MTPIIQISFVYLQLYIPFVSLFWLMFGHYKEGADISKDSSLQYNTTISPMENSSDSIYISVLIIETTKVSVLTCKA